MNEIIFNVKCVDSIRILNKFDLKYLLDSIINQFCIFYLSTSMNNNSVKKILNDVCKYRKIAEILEMTINEMLKEDCKLILLGN